MPLDPDTKKVVDEFYRLEIPEVFDIDLAEARREYVAAKIPETREPVFQVSDEVASGRGGDVPVRIYRPSDDQFLPAVVFFHGGGWVIGDVESHDQTCRLLANGSECVVVSVDYRCAPEHRYPAAAEDCYTATQWVGEHASKLGIDVDRVAVGGDSAGANLAAAAALMARDRGGTPLAFQLLVYPPVEATFSRESAVENANGYVLSVAAMKWYWDQYVPDLSRREESYCAPIHATDLRGLPPVFVMVAEYDPLRDGCIAYAERLAADGVQTLSLIHI